MTVRPTSKVTAGAIGGAVAAVTIGMADWLGAPTPPPGLEAGLATLLGFAFAYLTPERSNVAS